MKRSPALASLSRDHHQALFVAQQLKRATEENASQTRSRFLGYWTDHGRRHFRLEEEILLPGYAAYGDAHHPLVLQALGDHVELRRRAELLGAEQQATPRALQETGELLAAHVRLEERQLFPLIERVMPEQALASLAEAMEQAERA